LLALLRKTAWESAILLAISFGPLGFADQDGHFHTLPAVVTWAEIGIAQKKILHKTRYDHFN